LPILVVVILVLVLVNASKWRKIEDEEENEDEDERKASFRVLSGLETPSGRSAELQLCAAVFL